MSIGLSFDWDPEKAARNLARHGVTFNEAASVFADRLSLTIPDPRHSIGEERLALLGLSARVTCLLWCTRSARISFESSAREPPRAANGGCMKKARPSRSPKQRVNADEPLPEYDFRGRIRGKYAARFAAGTNLVLLDPDVAEFFPDATSVNDALRALATIAGRPRRRASHRRSA